MRRLFVVRIMKTGSTSFLDHVRNNFTGPRDVYPTGGIDIRPGDITAASSIPHLLGLPKERRDEIRAFIGHFPYLAYEKLGIECTTVTILRDPVARIASYLRQARTQPKFRDYTLEAIYEDPLEFGMFMHNHQTKNFAMTDRDPGHGVMDVIDIDDRRLELAKENLAKIDVVGFTERYDEFLEEMRTRFGWTIQLDVMTNVSSDDWQPSDALRRKIEADNAADIEFYEYARALFPSRR